MHSKRYKLIEFLSIFIILPLSFMLEYPFVIKASLAIIGFAYVIYILIKVYKQKFKIATEIQWLQFWKRLIISLAVIALMTIIYVFLTTRDELFRVMYEKPGLWAMVLFVYVIFSVYPQELIFRTFFFLRYETFVQSKWLFVILNAAVFSLAHISYGNGLVMLITFIGGLLFAVTYRVTRSTFLVAIEHAIYGCWLFTVGMGHMLGFPS